MGYPPENCGMSGICQVQFVVEADGGVYPCDFYVLDEWYKETLRHRNWMSWGISSQETLWKSQDIDPKCRQCKWVNLCRGGCRRNREPFIDDKPVLNYFCSSYMDFLNMPLQDYTNWLCYLAIDNIGIRQDRMVQVIKKIGQIVIKLHQTVPNSLCVLYLLYWPLLVKGIKILVKKLIQNRNREPGQTISFAFLCIIHKLKREEGLLFYLLFSQKIQLLVFLY